MDSCQQRDIQKIEMVQTFETTPDWAHYNFVHETTQKIAHVMDKKRDEYRGPITHPFSS